MTELDPDTKARIEAEERYRAELRAREAASTEATTPPPPPATPAKKRGGCGKWVLIGLGVIVGLGILGSLIGGGEQASTNTPADTNPPAVEASTPPGQDTAPVQEPPQANDGDGVVQPDGSQNVGVWNIGDVSWGTASNLGGEFGENAGEGETFVVVKYTLKNTTNETQNYSSLIDQPQLVLSDGGLIDADTVLSGYAGGQMIDGQIAPGLKRSGSYAFRVPSGKTDGMKFQIQFFNGKRVSFDLVK